MNIEIDTNSAFGARAERRLREDAIIWLTTVSASGQPHPRPVWFWWDGERILIFSKPHTYKVDHIRSNPRVALNLDGDGRGGDIIVLLGEARIAGQDPDQEKIAAYLRKYEQGLRRIGMTAEQFRESYSVPIWIAPRRLRGH